MLVEELVGWCLPRLDCNHRSGYRSKKENGKWIWFVQRAAIHLQSRHGVGLRRGFPKHLSTYLFRPSIHFPSTLHNGSVQLSPFGFAIVHTGSVEHLFLIYILLIILPPFFQGFPKATAISYAVKMVLGWLYQRYEDVNKRFWHSNPLVHPLSALPFARMMGTVSIPVDNKVEKRKKQGSDAG